MLFMSQLDEVLPTLLYIRTEQEALPRLMMALRDRFRPCEIIFDFAEIVFDLVRSVLAMPRSFLALRDRFWPCKMIFGLAEIVFGLARSFLALPRSFLALRDLFWPFDGVAI